MEHMTGAGVRKTAVFASYESLLLVPVTDIDYGSFRLIHSPLTKVTHLRVYYSKSQKSAALFNCRLKRTDEALHVSSCIYQVIFIILCQNSLPRPVAVSL